MNFFRSSQGSVSVEGALLFAFFIGILSSLLDFIIALTVGMNMDYVNDRVSRSLSLYKIPEIAQSVGESSMISFAQSCIFPIEYQYYEVLDSSFADPHYGVLSGSFPSYAVGTSYKVSCEWRYMTPWVRFVLGDSVLFEKTGFVVFP